MSKIINELDNVAICLEQEGQVPAGHKVALKNINKGDCVIKYGEIIGVAKDDIKAGEWVHTHNLKSNLDSSFSYEYSPKLVNLPKKCGSFKGFKRKDGRAGIRNEIYIIPTVGCVNSVCKKLEKLSQEYISGSLDGVYALTHQFGCSQLGNDNLNIKNILCSIAMNPNATYVLFVGLGCENNSLYAIKEQLDSLNRDNVKYLICQKVEDEIEEGMKILKDLCFKASTLSREEVDLSELCIGLKCGGSDGYSGITANPTVGKVCDNIVSFGGSAVLTEVPEMFGAEQILMNKCKDNVIFEKYKKLIFDFKDYYISQGFPVYENPSPGNREGGITTLEEKSLGCITKAGSSPINDVLFYGERVKENGVSVLQGPGNDLIASTALGAAGCQIILFTTGRGTPFSTFVPTIKIGTNNHISTYKDNWIDFNAFDMDDKGLFDLLIKVCNGETILDSESDHEIAFYKTGVTL
mgnify:CR=1 FL=1